MTSPMTIPIPTSPPTRAQVSRLEAAPSAAAPRPSPSHQPVRPAPASATASPARDTASSSTAAARAAATLTKSARPRAREKSTSTGSAAPAATVWSLVDKQRPFHSRSFLDPSIFFYSTFALSFLRRFSRFWHTLLDDEMTTNYITFLVIFISDLREENW